MSITKNIIVVAALAAFVLVSCTVADVIAQVRTYIQVTCDFVANYDDVREALRGHLPGGVNQGTDFVRGVGDAICDSVVEGGPAPAEALAVAVARPGQVTVVGATASYGGRTITGYVVRVAE